MSTELFSEDAIVVQSKELKKRAAPKEIPTILYDDVQVWTLSTIDAAASLSNGTSSRAYRRNEDLFREGVDVYHLDKSYDQEYIRSDYKIPVSGVTVLTTSGVMILTTLLKDKKARVNALLNGIKASTDPLLPSPGQPPLAISISTINVNRTPFRIAFFSDRPHVPWVALEDLVYIYPTGCSALAIKQQIERNFQGEVDLTRLAEAPSPTAFTRVEHAVDYAKRWTTSASALINERIEAITLRALDTITQLLDAKPVTQALQLGYDDLEIDPEPPIFDHCPSGYTTFDAAMGQYGYQSGFSSAGFRAFLDDLPEFYYRPNLFDDTSKSRIWRQQDIIRALSSQSDTLALPPRSSQLLLASC